MTFQRNNDHFNLRGQVQVFENNCKLVDTSNIIVYLGREWLAQRAFNIANTQATSYYNDMEDSFISWIGFGSGGASEGDILTPLPSESTDLKLRNPVMLDESATDYIQLNTDNYQGTMVSWQLKPIDGSIQFLEDSNNEARKLITSVNTTLLKTDANGPDGESFYNINEVGLFISNSKESSSVSLDTIQLFARTSFSTLRKVASRQLVFVWNIYF